MITAGTYLALGDSYTIGEGVPLHESFPYQVVQLLRQEKKVFNAPEIIARTGWTTSELASRIDHTPLSQPYDFVTLLIGVNNQYRGLLSSHYTLEFEELLERAINLTSANKRVFVLSIPDWSRTPYASDRNVTKVSNEISLFNNINRVVTRKHNCNYLDITTASPIAEDVSFLASDGLHPSAKEYFRWAKMLAENFGRITY
jgi:lysophospholipase L1-like esterase